MNPATAGAAAASLMVTGHKVRAGSGLRTGDRRCAHVEGAGWHGSRSGLLKQMGRQAGRQAGWPAPLLHREVGCSALQAAFYLGPEHLLEGPFWGEV